MKNFKIIIKIIKLPTPINISIWWNFGSILGLCLIIQLVTGILLSIHYCPNINLAFNRIIHLIKDIWYGWLIRLIHINGASLFFFCLYIHIGRGIYYNSFKYKITWIIGTIIILFLIITAFIGYILPWGQISFWGATVITNLISAIPIFGKIIVEWIWGGFTINNATLNRFFTIHFLMPFILSIIVLIHLTFLHKTGSNNPLGLNRNINKIIFYPYFVVKDLFIYIIIIIIFLLICFINPYIVSDPENFIPANPIITPIHIQPEWYFLFAYSILRTIPNKLGGVIGLILSIIILLLLPFIKLNKLKFIYFNPINKIIFWIFMNLFIILTIVGSKPIEYPYNNISQILTYIYFIYFLLLNLISKIIYFLINLK